MKQCWAAPERNRGPILEVLARVLPRAGRVLELASGSGQHAVHFARALPALTWLPSDVEQAHLASIRAWVREAALPNLHEPARIDVRAGDWGVGTVDAIFAANLLHVAPWECTVALLAGTGRYLASDGVLFRFPRLEIGVVEQGASWVPSWMRYVDSAFEAFRRREERLQKLALRPSEYVRRQARVTPYPAPRTWAGSRARPAPRSACSRPTTRTSRAAATRSSASRRAWTDCRRTRSSASTTTTSWT